jgi:hypothetical protein
MYELCLHQVRILIQTAVSVLLFHCLFLHFYRGAIGLVGLVFVVDKEVFLLLAAVVLPFPLFVDLIPSSLLVILRLRLLLVF